MNVISLNEARARLRGDTHKAIATPTGRNLTLRFPARKVNPRKTSIRLTCAKPRVSANCPVMERFEEQVKKALAKRLKRARLDAGFRFANEFAAVLGMEDATYRTYERGEHLPDIPTLTRICKLLNVEPNFLLPLAVKKEGTPPQSRMAG
jgi:ribosome-binding protein aMBF1 (putative translation factor)